MKLITVPPLKLEEVGRGKLCAMLVTCPKVLPTLPTLRWKSLPEFRERNLK
jgi:hypothetical protein